MPCRNKALALLVAASILLFSGIAGRDFSTRGEPREALIAQAMLNTGNWVLPQGYGGAVPSKPPLMHWLISLVSLPRGEVTEFTSRLPSALLSMAFLFYFFYFIAKRRGEDRAFFSALILLTTFEWFRAATSSRVDMTLSACLAGGLLALFKWSEEDCEGAPILPIALIALATLSKGPVAIALSGAIWVTYLFLCKIPISRIFSSSLRVFVPALLIASIWYILAAGERGGDFFAKFYYENIARFSSTMDDEPHAHSVFYLIGVTILGLLPWVLVPLIVAFKEKPTWQEFRNKIRNLQNLEQFSLIVFIAFFVFFSIPSSKRAVYLLPAYPFVCFLIGSFVTKLAAQSSLFASRISLFGSLALVGFFLGNVANSQYSNRLSPKVFSQEIRSLLSNDSKLYSYGDEFYGISFYLNKRMFRVEEIKPEKGFVLTYERNLNLKSLRETFAGYKTFNVVKISSTGIVKRGAKVAAVFVEK